MFNSQYYTCEQIDQRLLQGYLDDYNSQNNTNLTKDQFLTLLFNTIGRNSTVYNLVTQIGYYECDTAGATAAKAITVANYALFAGGSMKVKFINKNTANNATLNINSQGAKALYYQGERASATNSWDAEEVVEIYYDGTSYYANNVKGGSGSGVYDVSKEHPTSGPNNDGKFTLEYILNQSNVNELIPVNKRYPGMSIQFISTPDNKYVKFFCTANEFTTDVTQWQGVDTELLPSSKNLTESRASYSAVAPLGCQFLELDGNSCKENAAYNTSGEYITSNYRRLTPFIKVNEGDILYCKCGQNASQLAIIAFNSNKEVVLASCESGNYKDYYVVPTGIEYLRFGCVSTNVSSFKVSRIYNDGSRLALCYAEKPIDFDNFAKKIFGGRTRVKVGNYLPVEITNIELDYSWTTVSSKYVTLYIDVIDGTLKLNYFFRTPFNNPIIALLEVSGTDTDLKVIRVLSCALPYTIDGLREDQLPPVTITKHIQLASDDFKHPHRYSNTGEMNRSNYRRMTDYYKVLQGQKFQCVLDQGTQNDLSVIAFDSELNLLTDESYSGDINGIYTVPTGVSYLRFGCSSTGAASASVEEIEKWQEEINEVANSVLIPDYFDNQVSSQIANASNDIVEANINGDNFIFITDIHWERNNKNAPALIRHICDKMAMSQVIFGGDAIDGQAQQSVAMSYFNAIAKIKGADSNFLAAFGNHDANSLAGGTAFSPYNIAFYSLMQKPADRISVHNSGNITDYYIDNPTTNTRYIVLDTRTNHAFATATSNWLTNVLTDTPNDMHIIIVLHSYMYTTPIYDGSTVIGYDGAISNAGTSLNNILSNFTTKKIEAVFSGHMHMDYNGMTDNMIPVVVNDCDSKATSMWENVDGTVNEQSFDIVTVNYTTKLISCRRIGRGKSRLIHYTPYTLNVGETLDISSLLTIVPTSYSTRDNMLSHYLKANPVPKTTFYSNNATISNAGIVTAVAAGYVTAVAENDDFIETFNIKVNE